MKPGLTFRMILLLLGLAWQRPLLACTCTVMPLEHSWARADYVLVGKFLGYRESTEAFRWGGKPITWERIEMVMDYKPGLIGSMEGDSIKAKHRNLSLVRQSACYMNFEEGEYYLIFAQFGSQIEGLHTSYCYGTESLSEILGHEVAWPGDWLKSDMHQQLMQVRRKMASKLSNEDPNEPPMCKEEELAAALLVTERAQGRWRIVAIAGFALAAVMGVLSFGVWAKASRRKARLPT